MLLGLLCCLVLAACAHSAMARPAKGGNSQLVTDFDLARHGSEQAASQRYRIAGTDGNAFPKGDNGPHWSTTLVSGGPTLEAGALGGGRKGMPGLAHVAMDWSF